MIILEPYKHVWRELFEYSDSPVNIKYIADSRHNFNYGHPLDNFEYTKFQLLLHPDEWSKDGLNAESNFALLFKENSEKFEQNLLNESSHFIKYKDKVSKNLNNENCYFW